MTIAAFAVVVAFGLLGGFAAWRRARRGAVRTTDTVAIGAGAAGGIGGALLLSVPLDFCTFDAEAAAKDVAFGVVLMAIGAYAAVRLVTALLVPKQRRPAGDVNRSVWSGGVLNRIYPWLLLTPTLIILVLFLYWPQLKTIGLSTKLARRGAPRTVDRCVTNFTELMGPSRPWVPLVVAGLAVIALVGAFQLRRMPQFWAQALRPWASAIGVALVFLALAYLWTDAYRKVYIVTMTISLATVAGGLLISLAIAYLAYQPIRGASVYRTLLVWPYAISPPIAGLIFFVLFDANTGIIDHMTTSLLGWGLPDYRTNTALAQLVVILASIWKTLGYNLLFYVAGLQNVPNDQVEAAMLDGANSFQRFRYVVVPALSPITFFLIVTNLTYAFFETYGTIDYLTRGGPAGGTSVAMYEIIRVFSTEGDLGRGAAQSMILFAGVVALTLWQFQSTGRRVTYG